MFYTSVYTNRSSHVVLGGSDLDVTEQVVLTVLTIALFSTSANASRL